MSIKNPNYAAALAILKGKTVLAHDRRKSDAHAIDHKVFRTKGWKVLRPSYGISNTLHTTLEKLARKVVFTDGMPSYYFAA